MDMLRLPQVLQKTGYRSHTSIYEAVKAGTFPRPVRLGLRAVGWPDHEVETILKAWVAGVSESEIRNLVESLHHRRSAETR